MRYLQRRRSQTTGRGNTQRIRPDRPARQQRRRRAQASHDLLEADEESFDRLININLKGPYFLTQLVAREHDRGERRGKIVNITSVSAYTASTNRGDYCIAKAGLSMMTKLFAARLAEFGINVYEIRPGVIETDMTGPVKAKYDKLIFEKDLTPIQRWGQPDDVAPRSWRSRRTCCPSAPAK